MAVIGNLAIQLSTRTAGLQKGMRNAQTSVQRFAKTAKAASKVAAGIGLVAAGGAAVGLGVMVKKQLGAVDALGKMSDRLGIATEDLAALQLGAKLSGLEITAMEKAVQKMVGGVADAANGTGEAANAIKDLGLNADELARLAPDKQLRAIADAIKDVRKQSDRVRIAGDLFGERGIAMLQMIQNGSAGLDDFARAAEKAGTAISRYDASKVEQMNDAITKMQEAATGFARRLAVQVAPGLQLTFELFDDFLSSGQHAANGVSSAFGGFADTLLTLSQLIDDIDIGMTKMGFSVMKEVGGIIQTIGNLTGKDNLIGAGIGISTAGATLEENYTATESERTRRMAQRIADIQIAAHKKAKELADRVLGKGFDLPGVGGQNGLGSIIPPKKPTFEQVRFDRLATGVTTSKPQPVRVDGLADVHQTLKEIKKNTMGPAFAVTTA